MSVIPFTGRVISRTDMPSGKGTHAYYAHIKFIDPSYLRGLPTQNVRIPRAAYRELGRKTNSGASKREEAQISGTLEVIGHPPIRYVMTKTR